MEKLLLPLFGFKVSILFVVLFEFILISTKTKAEDIQFSKPVGYFMGGYFGSIPCIMMLDANTPSQFIGGLATFIGLFWFSGFYGYEECKE